MLLAAEVERVFRQRGWQSNAQAAVATRLPVSTIRRLRLGEKGVKVTTAGEFGVAVGEPEERWRLIASGINPDAATFPEVASLLDVADVVPRGQAELLLRGMERPVEVGANLERITTGEIESEPVRFAAPVQVMRIRHECMRPLLMAGDVVFVTAPEFVEDGNIVIAAVDVFGRTCKRIRIPREGRSYLEPLNGEGVIDESRFVVLGVVKFRLQAL